MKNATIAALIVLVTYGVDPYAVLLYAVTLFSLNAMEYWIKENKREEMQNEARGIAENIRRT